MPCVERFLKLPGDEQRKLIRRGKARLVAVEAAVGIDWYRIVGDGLVVGIDRFGASAPEKALAEAYDLTPQKVAGRVSHGVSTGRGGRAPTPTGRRWTRQRGSQNLGSGARPRRARG